MVPDWLDKTIRWQHFFRNNANSHCEFGTLAQGYKLRGPSWEYSLNDLFKALFNWPYEFSLEITWTRYFYGVVQTKIENSIRHKSLFHMELIESFRKSGSRVIQHSSRWKNEQKKKAITVLVLRSTKNQPNNPESPALVLSLHRFGFPTSSEAMFNGTVRAQNYESYFKTRITKKCNVLKKRKVKK